MEDEGGEVGGAADEEEEPEEPGLGKVVEDDGTHQGANCRP